MIRRALAYRRARRDFRLAMRAHGLALIADLEARRAELADLARTCPPARVNPDGSPA